MKVAIIGSKKLKVNNLKKYLPYGVTEFVSGGSRGINTCAKNYAKTNGLKMTEFIPEYIKYGRSATLRRNLQIINYADIVIAFWDGQSQDIKKVIISCIEKDRKLTVYTVNNQFL